MANCNENFLKLSEGYLFPEIARRTRAWQDKNPGVEVLRLGIGNTTEPLSKTVVDAMVKRALELGKVETYSGYGDEQGNKDLREALSEFYKKSYNVDIAPLEFFISDGAKSDAANIQEIFSSSSVVAIQNPAYPVYVDSNVAAGKTGPFNKKIDGYDGIYYMDSTKENNFVPALPERHVDLIYLCFPNNPTGTVATKEDLKRFVDWAIENDAIIIFDAAYAEFIESDGIPRTIYEIEGAEKCAIELNSFSKQAGFTGVRLGWTIVPSALKCQNAPEGTLHRLWLRRQTTFFNGASNIAQAGGVASLTDEGLKENRETIRYYKENAKIIKDTMEALGFTCYGGVDSPYVWMECPEGKTSWEFFDFLLDKCHVVVTPGSGFGPKGEGYVRISAFGHRENILKACQSIKEHIND